MIECLPGTVLPLDQRVYDEWMRLEGWAEQARFDEEFIGVFPAIHGGTPVKPFFTDSSGQVRRIGWFVSLYDLNSELPGPRQPDHMYHDSDTRIIDRSLPYLLDGESSIYGPSYHDVRFYPFAAVLSGDALNDESVPLTLCWHFGSGSDSLCFNISTDPISVVYCNFDRAIEEFNVYDSALGNVYDFSHLIPVAGSFREFAQMLRSEL